jgi:hypothetical protein
MKKTLSQTFVKCAKMTAAATVAAFVFSACSKSSSSVTTTKVTAQVIGSNTSLTGGAWKGTLLAGTSYTINGDITVLPTDTLTVQAGANIVVPANHAFYIQGVIQSLGTQTSPIVFTSPTQQPGQWGGFQCDSAKAVTFFWTRVSWTGGPDSSGSTRQTIGVSSPIPVDIEDCWFIGGQDNSIGVYSTATVKILRNTFQGNGTTDGDAIDFHSGVTGTVAYNVLWGGAGSAIKVYTSATIANPQTNVDVYNNTCIDNGFRRGAAEPGRGILVDAFSKARVYNNLLVNNYWSLDVTPTADFANTKYGNNYFYVTVDSLRKFMYPNGEKGMIQSSDVIDSVNLSANNPMFVNYSAPPIASARIMPNTFDFHLQANSPAKGMGTTAYTPVATGSPALSADMGAFVSDTTGGKGNRH